MTFLEGIGSNPITKVTGEVFRNSSFNQMFFITEIVLSLVPDLNRMDWLRELKFFRRFEYSLREFHLSEVIVCFVVGEVQRSDKEGHNNGLLFRMSRLDLPSFLPNLERYLIAFEQQSFTITNVFNQIKSLCLRVLRNIMEFVSS